MAPLSGPFAGVNLDLSVPLTKTHKGLDAPTLCIVGLPHGHREPTGHRGLALVALVRPSVTCPGATVPSP